MRFRKLSTSSPCQGCVSRFAAASRLRSKSARENRAGERLAARLHQAGAEGRQAAQSFGPLSEAEQLLELLAVDPYQKPPPFEKLVGDLAGAYSRRINVQHRLVYQVIEQQRVVKVLRMWTHYE